MAINTKLVVTRRLLRILVWPLSLIVPTLSLVGSGIVALLHSPNTLPWCIELAQIYAPGMLQVESASGRLVGPWLLRGLTFQNSDITVKVGQLRLDWDLSALLRLELAIVELSVDQIHIILPQTKTPLKQDTQFPQLVLPIGISIDKAELANIHITQPRGDSIRIDYLALSAIQVQGHNLDVGQLGISALGSKVQIAGNIDLVPTLPMNIRIQWAYQPPTGTNLAGDGTIVGSLEKLHITQTLLAPINTKFRVSVQGLQHLPTIDIQTTINSLDLATITPNVPVHVTGQMRTLSTNPANFTLTGQLHIESPSIGTLSTDINTAYTNHVITIQHLLVKHPTGGQITLTGHYKPDNNLGKFAAQLNWQALRWPLAGEAIPIHSPSGEFKITGQPTTYHYNVTTNLTIPNTPSLAITAAGMGDLKGVRLANVVLQAQQMRITGVGGASWAPKQTWNIKLQGKNLSTATIHPDLPGRITATVAASGQIIHNQLQLGPITANARGIVRNHRFLGTAKLQLRGNTLENPAIEISQLDVKSGSNHLIATGQVGDNLAINWTLSAPDLNVLLPQLQGQLNVTGKIHGLRTAPQILAKIVGTNLTYLDVLTPQSQILHLNTLATTADLNLTNPGRVAVKLQMQELTAAGYQWQGLELTATGTAADHQLQLALVSKQAPTVKVQLNATVTPDLTWQGTFKQLALVLPQLTTLTLQHPTSFTLAARHQHLDNLCLQATLGTICGTFTANVTEGWQAQLQATKINLTLLKPWLPANNTLDGHAEFAAQLQTNPAGQLHGQASMVVPSGIISITTEETAPIKNIDFSGAQIQAQLQPTKAKITAHVPLIGLGTIDSQISLAQFNPMHLNLTTQPLSGYIKASLPDLSFIRAFSSQIANAQGRFDLNYQIGGQLATPKFLGQATLANGTLDIPTLGLAIKDIALQVQGNQQHSQLNYKGSARSGANQLILTGNTRFAANTGAVTTLNLDGADLLAVNLPEAEVKISPHLRLSNANGQTNITGKVQIPYARLHPYDLPTTAVVNSNDLRIQHGKNQPAPPATPTDLHAEIQIILGNDINFKGFGVRANPTGSLTLSYKPGRPVLGRGRIGMNAGTYRAYGQDLSIKKAYILFADSPLDNPGLDVQAVRIVDTVTAGVKIIGTLKQPKLTLFSTPSLAQNDILSYILRGRPANLLYGQAGDTAPNSTQVATTLLSGEFSKLTEEAARRLGIDELKVDTTDELNQTSVTVGKYLSPRLYIQYANTPGTSESTARLRYDLTERIQIQTETGKDQGVDLFYTIER